MLLWLLAISVGAQTPEASLKAAFSLNFAKFAHWPEEAGGTPLQALKVCMVGRSQVASVLSASEGESVGGRSVSFDYVRLPGDVSGCHLLYVSELDLDRDRRLLASLSALPVLTISDLPGFARAGGMIELLVIERRLRFEINLDVVRAAGLRLDPKLLRLAIKLYGDRQGDGQ
jgi:hypothetical protein